MSRFFISRRARPRRHGRRWLWESLESRLVMSGVLYTDPAPGSVLTQSPESYRVAFDTTLADYSFSLADVAIDRVGTDGLASRAFDDQTVPFQSLDDSGTTLVFSLVAALEPGVYRLVLAGDSFLTAEDGTFLGPQDGMDQVLSEFTIARPGVKLADAQDLGVVGPQVISTQGALDLASNPSDVRLYKVSLAKGHFWRLGLEVGAERQGSPLNAAITLFDASGKAIASNDVGRSDAPSDPFLFLGLPAGDYYVGVSASGNIAGRADGYNIVTGETGATRDQPGGAFSLNVVADQADVPGALVDFRVNRADPLDPTPTGFTLRFSTPLGLGSSGHDVSSHASHGIEVVDSFGASWPIAAVNYNEARGALQFLFGDRLPVGTYTIRLSTANPLVDLAGRSPISPRMPRGVLATFAVSPDLRPREADGSLSFDASVVPGGETVQTVRAEDVGSLTPSMALKSITRSLTLQPGQSAVYRFVNLYAGNFQLVLQSLGGALSADLIGGDAVQHFGLDASRDSQQHMFIATLGAGEYFLRITASNALAVTFSSTIQVPGFSWDSLLANGIGQGPALNLRLVAPDSSAIFGSTTGSTILGGGGGGSISVAPAGPTAGPLAPGSVPTDGFGTYGTFSVSSGSSSGSSGAASYVSPTTQAGYGLMPNFASAFVGRPSLLADKVDVVGPETVSNAVALAAAGRLPLQAGAAAASRRRFALSRNSIKIVVPDTHQPQEATPNGGLPAPAEDHAEPEADLSQASEHAASSAVSSVETEASQAISAVEPLRVGLVPTNGTEPEETEDEAIAPPSLLSSGTVGLVGFAGLAIHHAIRKWRTRRKPAVYKRQTPAPHSFSRRVRV